MGLLARVRRARKAAGSAARLLALTLAAAACGPSTESPKLAFAAGEWLEFTGTWGAAGSRHTIPLGEGRTGAVVQLRGTMLLAGPGKPGVGFHAEVIGLVDSVTGFDGRSVWTDERGDQVFSALHGEGTVENNLITGTILSGTGRYAGTTGSYEFSWLRLLESEDGSVQGRAVDLKGRVLPGPAAGGALR